MAKHRAYEKYVPVVTGPGGCGRGGGVDAGLGGGCCTSDLLDDSAWTPLDLEGALTTSAVDRHEVSFRARAVLSKTSLTNPATSTALSCIPCLRIPIAPAASQVDVALIRMSSPKYPEVARLSIALSLSSWC